MELREEYQIPLVKMVTIRGARPLCGSKTPVDADWETEDYGNGDNYGDDLFD